MGLLVLFLRTQNGEHPRSVRIPLGSLFGAQSVVFVNIRNSSNVMGTPDKDGFPRVFGKHKHLFATFNGADKLLESLVLVQQPQSSSTPLTVLGELGAGF